MTQQLDIIGETGIQFFGKISASISHEFKNALAIINENAGLLDDFTLMAEKGIPIDPERLRFPAENIAKQIQRANEIVKRMNQFSHSTDKSLKMLELGEMTKFMATISERFAAIRSITLDTKLPETPIMILTHPFLLETLIFLCLDFAMDAVGEKKTIGIITGKTENSVCLRFTGLKRLGEVQTDFPTGREMSLLAYLNAELATETDAGEIILYLPEKISESENT
ncbi:HAMP domain-containing histidine kinase [Desulfonema magnum]|uniref:histidine kinase n=1 Tax=Desulfonema magnum TaxID=45655 RepID=A0A975BV24_9BACT|nr:HAMP domain-containing histidine kinase [Desulfonema magnum]QTA92301.1 histidine kinase domain-containing protein [Desulfonema magnum]